MALLAALAAALVRTLMHARGGASETEAATAEGPDEATATALPGRAASPGSLTVLVPAYNEAAFVGDTIRSLQEQTRPPDEVIIIDDFSDDGTGDVARALGVRVVRPPANTGSKAGAQNFALPLVETDLVMAVDADTSLAPDAIERLLPALDEPGVAAACGYVLPRRVRSICERGRYIEYLFAFSFGKQVQDYFAKPMISSGCFSAYRVSVLREVGGWSTRTLAEDMDLTWTLYRLGHRVRFVPAAVSYPLEPQTFRLMGKQLRRWSHGFLQNVRLHWRGLLRFGYLRSLLAVALWDSIVASLAYIVVFPVLAIAFSPIFLAGYLIDAPAVLVPALVGAARRRETRKALASYPCFFVLRMFNAAVMLRAVWAEAVLRRSFNVYEKGH